MPKRMGKTDRIIVTMYPEVGDALRQIAAERGMSMGDVMMELLVQHGGVPTPPRLQEELERRQARNQEQLELASA